MKRRYSGRKARSAYDLNRMLRYLDRFAQSMDKISSSVLGESNRLTIYMADNPAEAVRFRKAQQRIGDAGEMLADADRALTAAANTLRAAIKGR